MDNEGLDRLNEALNESKPEELSDNQEKRQKLLYEISAFSNEELEKAVEKYRVNTQKREQ